MSRMERGSVPISLDRIMYGTHWEARRWGRIAKVKATMSEGVILLIVLGPSMERVIMVAAVSICSLLSSSHWSRPVEYNSIFESIVLGTDIAIGSKFAPSRDRTRPR